MICRCFCLLRQSRVSRRRQPQSSVQSDAMSSLHRKNLYSSANFHFVRASKLSTHRFRSLSISRTHLLPWNIPPRQAWLDLICTRQSSSIWLQVVRGSAYNRVHKASAPEKGNARVQSGTMFPSPTKNTGSSRRASQKPVDDGYSGVEIAEKADMVQPDNRPSTSSPSDWRTKPTKD